jgi:hypothetical protein
MEVRMVLDGCGLAGCHVVSFADSEFVTKVPDGTLRYASLRVGAIADGGDTVVLDDDASVEVGGNALTIEEIKEYLYGFADSIGTEALIETSDLRFSPWGFGSGSTTNLFETYIVDQLASKQPCNLRFSGDVRFDLPGENGEFFTGGFLDLPQEGFGTLLRDGDIAELVDGYEISSDGVRTVLTVDAQLGEVEFAINDDHTLTDEFDRVWTPESDFELIDPEAVDKVLGDIDGSGTVDFADFLILSKNFGTAESQGDLDCDGRVGFADFLILSAHFGRDTG